MGVIRTAYASASQYNQLVDVQNEIDYRDKPIDSVGVSKVQVPIRMLLENGHELHSIGLFKIETNLPKNTKGTHMSRLVQSVQSFASRPVSHSGLHESLLVILESLGVSDGSIEMTADIVISKKAPVSGEEGFLSYRVGIKAARSKSTSTNTLSVEVPVMLLCPCSKAISEMNAHNQRAIVRVICEIREAINPCDLIRLVESRASSPLYSVLKRSDEKYVTEFSYANPKFVEDMVRDVAVALDDIPSIGAYEVECESFESIHDHDAFAKLSSRKQP